MVDGICFLFYALCQARSNPRLIFEMSPSVEISCRGHSLKICKRGNPVGSLATQVRLQCLYLKEGNFRTIQKIGGFEALALGSCLGTSFYHPV